MNLLSKLGTIWYSRPLGIFFFDNFYFFKENIRLLKLFLKKLNLHLGGYNNQTQKFFKNSFILTHVWCGFKIKQFIFLPLELTALKFFETCFSYFHFFSLWLPTSQIHQVGFLQTTPAAAVVDGLAAPLSSLLFLLLQQPTTVDQTLLGTN